MLARPDSHVSRSEVIENCRAIVDATDLPVNVDLENGFAPCAPRRPLEAIRLAAEAGAARRVDRGRYRRSTRIAIYDFDLSVARVQAAAAVARALPVSPFLLIGAGGEPDPRPQPTCPIPSAACAPTPKPAPTCSMPLDCAICAEVRRVSSALNRPLNVVTGWLDPAITAGQLAEVGAKHHQRRWRSLSPRAGHLRQRWARDEGAGLIRLDAPNAGLLRDAATAG